MSSQTHPEKYKKGKDVKDTTSNQSSPAVSALQPVYMENPKGLDQLHVYPENAIDTVAVSDGDDSADDLDQQDDHIELTQSGPQWVEEYDASGLTLGVAIKPETDYEVGILNEKKVYKEQKNELRRHRRRKPRMNKEDQHREANLRMLSKQPEYMPTFCMMLGIRTMVSMVESKQFRKIQPSNFTTANKLRFPREGSTQTPAHNASSFRFKDYMPEVFRHIRAHFNLSPSDYITSVCGNYLFINFISNSKSGQFFFYSYDRRFMIKTITPAESKFLRKIIPQYYEHIMKYPNTLLSRFYGMHRVRFIGQREKHFLVMGSVFYTKRPMDIVYDLKGSIQGRSVTEAERQNPSGCVFKDNDFLDHKERLSIPSQLSTELLKQIEIDVEFLRSLGIMDYSFLVGLHDVDCEEEVENEFLYDSVGTAYSDAPHLNAVLNPTPSLMPNNEKNNSLYDNQKVNQDSLNEYGENNVSTLHGLPEFDMTTHEHLHNNSDTHSEHMHSGKFNPSTNVSMADSRGDELQRSSSARLTYTKRRSTYVNHIPTGYAPSKALHEHLNNSGDFFAVSYDNSKPTYTQPRLNIHGSNVSSRDPAYSGNQVTIHMKGRNSNAKLSGKSHAPRSANTSPSPIKSTSLDLNDHSLDKSLSHVDENKHRQLLPVEKRGNSFGDKEKVLTQYEEARISSQNSAPPALQSVTNTPSSTAHNVQVYINESHTMENISTVTTTVDAQDQISTTETKQDMRPAPIQAVDGITMTFPQDVYTVKQIGDNGKEETVEGVQSIFMKHDGGMLGVRPSDGHRMLYYVGIIDILTFYNWRKRGECWLKSLKYDKNDISAVSPKRYAKRFVEYMKKAMD